MNTLLPRRILAVLLLVGAVAGCVGIGLTHLLHAVQQLVFQGSLHSEHIPFRQLVQAASPLHRFWALLGCGAVVGIAWTCLHRYGAPLCDIKTTVKQPARAMPLKTTLCHALLQIITVGMGSPLGREVAPREISVALATPLTRRFALTELQTSLVLACASGAGLAAVYNVPFAATVFVLETLLLTWSLPAVAAALLTCGLTVWVARLGLGDVVQYGHLPVDIPPSAGPSLLIWSAAAGGLLAAAVWAFEQCQSRLPKFNPRRWTMLPIALLCFAAIGALSIPFPEILGNGKAGNELSFSHQLTVQAAFGLLAAKWLAVLLAGMAGAYGGRITPSMMLGGLTAFIGAWCWNLVFPPVPLGLAAFIGAAVFLGLAQNMALTSLVFLLELSHQSTAVWLPMCLCMATALTVRQTVFSRQ